MEREIIINILIEGKEGESYIFNVLTTKDIYKATYSKDRGVENIEIVSEDFPRIMSVEDMIRESSVSTDSYFIVAEAVENHVINGWQPQTVFSDNGEEYLVENCFREGKIQFYFNNPVDAIDFYEESKRDMRMIAVKIMKVINVFAKEDVIHES